MHELLNTRTGKTIAFASEVDELTPKQYLFYVDLYLRQLSGLISDPHELKRKLFANLTDLRLSWKLTWYRAEVEEAIWSALTDKIDLLDSFFDIEDEEGHKVYRMQIKSGHNLLPRWNGYKGPDDMLNNLKWGEFIQCLDCLKQIQQATEEQDAKAIDELTRELFHVMYKPVGTVWKWNMHEFEAVLFHCLTYFSYVYELITTVPIPIKGNEIPLYIIWENDDEEDESESDKTEWAGILFSLAEAGTFGKLDDVNNQNLWDILLYLYKQKFAAREERKRMKKQQPNGTT